MGVPSIRRAHIGEPLVPSRRVAEAWVAILNNGMFIGRTAASSIHRHAGRGEANSAATNLIGPFAQGQLIMPRLREKVTAGGESKVNESRQLKAGIEIIMAVEKPHVTNTV